jgi:hypothetical protein
MECKVVDNKLSAVSQGIRSLLELPESITSQSPSIKGADFSFNDITDLKGLDKFRNLETLILDNNKVSSLEFLPDLPRLNTLWLNKNELMDIEAVLSAVSKQCPRLTYLSLLGNPCCANELNGNAFAEYTRLRLYICYRIPTLKFLDAMPVTEEERAESKKQGPHSKVIRIAAAVVDTPANEGEAAIQSQNSATFFKEDPQREGRHATYFSYQKQQYSGKSSEGNRFIKDDKL